MIFLNISKKFAKTMQLSKDFTLEELISSNTARARKIDNNPSQREIDNLYKLANEVLQPIADSWNKPIKITSGYRSPRLNAAIKGAKNSQHVKGEAADIKAIGATNKELFEHIEKMIKTKQLKVGQLIWERGTKQEPQWVHVSLPYVKVNNILYLI